VLSKRVSKPLRGSDVLPALRKAIDELAAVDAADVVAEARASARARVRAVLADAMTDALLERSRLEIGARGIESLPPAATSPVALGWYVYGVVSAPGPVLPDDLPGVDPRHAPLIVVEDDLAAVVSQVPLAEFGDETLRENLDDPEWLEPRASTHECVLETVAALATVIPMRRCTVYDSESALRRMLVREHGPLTDGLERFAGTAEWRVAVLAGDTGVEPSPAQRNDLHERLAAVAVDALVDHPADHEAVMSGVYLVRDTAVGELRTAVAALNAEYEPLGFDVVLTGPAVPYTFVKGTIEVAW
jgi:hypothetical protein